MFLKSQKNLISVSKFLLEGTIKDELYVFPTLNSYTAYSANHTSFITTKPYLKIWHARLGHCNNEVLQQVLKHMQFCDACIIGKAHNSHFFFFFNY